MKKPHWILNSRYRIIELSAPSKVELYKASGVTISEHHKIVVLTPIIKAFRFL